MLFAHFSDCHVGGWKEEKLKDLNMQCFKKAIALVMERNVDFLLISGDLFNTALPQIDYIKECTSELKKLKDANIPVYMIAGSHDYSPSGKTMLDVLEKAGLIINVMNFHEDGTLKFTLDKTGAKITGMLGKKGGLEINDYETLQTQNLEAEEGFKIFMFHTAINEFKPQGLEDMAGADAAHLPKNFHYYAGGHVHYIFQKNFGQGVLTFPGALFPNNFKEMEEWQYGGVYFVNEHAQWEYVRVKIKDVETFSIAVDDLSPEQATAKILQEVKKKDTKDKIITLRVHGEIQGKSSDVNFQEILTQLQEAYFVLKNTSKLQSKQGKEITMKLGTVEEIEEEILKEHVSEIQIKDIEKEKEEHFTQLLMQLLNKEKEDGEKVQDFEKRIISEGLKVLDVETA
ncbi:MAG: metallophosphoesterase [archaeon GW2011_AR17]|nr:MAG: metallophosphoesterase [archaeon GW2011_AR17]MBS3154568.1 DNA repair exonuclease [Candidatus Woesearchaeota archaeon]HIH15526.1 DNA repair exonuclease [Nanoarchaeota archaeon]HIH59505.1 DNA repair exonuclease [Nanoarchaeota archaeon]HII14109.1 DNA repair exonuclease [Nanoarchaeota archaeon]